MPNQQRTCETDSLRWLLSDQATEYLSRCTEDPTPSTTLVTGLRKQLTATRARLVMEQAELRQRAKTKFSRARQMFFERTALEQATDEVLATYKSRCFGPAPIADLCCGIGGDLIGLGGDRFVVGVERNAWLAAFAERNAAVYAHENVEVQCNDVTGVRVEEFAAWHLDPDRRPEGRRTTHVEFHEPGLKEIDALLARNENGGIKLAPATTVPDAWIDRAELEWLGHRRECQQLFAKFGSLAAQPGRKATVLLESGPVTIRSSGQAGLPPVGPVGAYVYEPHPAVVAAKLVDSLCLQLSMKRLSRRIAYATSDELQTHPAVTAFRVIESLPADLKRVKRLLRGQRIGRVEVKKRNTSHEPATVARQLAGPGDNIGVVLLAGLPEQTLAIVAERVS